MGSPYGSSDFDLLRRAAAELEAEAARLRTARQAPPGGEPARGPGGGGRGTLGTETEAQAGRLSNLTREQTAYEAALARTSAAENAASTAMRRHGALTTEFISAAARGETTIRELGFQTTATITKFGGWLVAGSAVYAALGAITALGHGALEANRGVNNLQRVVNNIDTSKAQHDMGELADRFNLPTDQVADAVYQMGKVFHSQTGAFKAAESVLFAVKVGELDVATASRYMISIVQGAHLPFQALGGVLDQVNQAQNRYGASIPDLLAGVSKATGAFQAAGDTGRQGVSDLITYIATLQRAAGITGDVAGTALQRAPHFISRPQNQAELAKFGIDTGQKYALAIREGIRIAPTLSGDDQRQLAEALFGPQYGSRVGIVLLRNARLQEQIAKTTSPQASKGSAQRELNRALESTSEHLKAVLVGLEQLGVELSRAGAFNALGALLELLNSSLDSVTFLVQEFNKLPGPIKLVASSLTQVLALLAVMRFFKFGEVFQRPGEAPVSGARRAAQQFFLPGGGELGGGIFGGDRTEALKVRKNIREQSEAYQATREEQTKIARQAAAEAATLNQRAIQQESQVNAMRRTGASAEEIARLQVQATDNAERALGLRQTEKDATAQAAAANTLASERQRQLRSIRTRFGGLNVPAALSFREPAFGVDTYDQPTTQAVRRLRTGLLEGVPLSPETQRQLQGASEKYADNLTNAGTAAVASSRAGFFSMREGMNRLSTGLGIAGNIMFAAFIGFTVGDLIKQMFESSIDQVDSINRQARTAQEARRRYESYAGRLQGQQSGWRGGPVGDVGRFFGNLSVGGLHPFLPSDPFGAEQQARESYVRDYQARQALQQRQRRRGAYVPFLFPKQLESEIDDLKNYSEGSKRWRQQLAVVQQELDHSGLGPKDLNPLRKAFKDTVAKAQADGHSLGALGNQIDVDIDTLVKQFQNTTKIYGAQYGARTGPTGRNARRMYNSFQAIVREAATSQDPKAIGKLLDARDEFYSQIEDTISQELEHDLQFARSPGERKAAFQNALQALQQSALGSSQQDIRKDRRQIQDVRERMAKLLQQQTKDLTDLFLHSENLGVSQGPISGAFHPQGINLKGLDPKLRKQIQQLQRRLKGDREQLKASKEFVDDLEQQLRETTYQANSAIREAREGAREALTADPILQAKEQINFLGDEIERAIRVFGRDSQEVYTLIQQRRQAYQQLAQSQAQLVRAQAETRYTAGVTDDVARSQGEIKAMQAELAYMQAHANQFDPAEIINLQNQITDAKAQILEDLESQAADNFEAAQAIAQARAEARGNEVGAIDAQIKAAYYTLRHADTLAERRQSQATLIGLRAQRRDQVAQNRIDDIEFEADIGKITTQQEIAAYERLLDTMKLSRDMRRDIRRKIHDLKQQLDSEGGDFDLSVGDIRLPTIYDIRRAVQGGISSNPQVHDNRKTTNNFTFNNNGDPGEVERRVNKVINGSNRSARQSAGLRG